MSPSFPNSPRGMFFPSSLPTYQVTQFPIFKIASSFSYNPLTSVYLLLPTEPIYFLPYSSYLASNAHGFDLNK